MLKYFYFLLLFISIPFFAQNNKSAKNMDSTYIYTEKAIFYKNNKTFDKSLELVNKAIKFSKKSNSTIATAESYLTLSLILIDLKKYDKAIENLIRTASILNTMDPNSKLASTYNSLGICYMHKLNFSRAESYFEKSIAIYESINLKNAKNMIMLQKGLLYMEKNEITTAQNLFNTLSLLEENNETRNIQIEALYQLGEITKSNKVYNLSLNYLNRAYQLAEKIKSVELRVKISKTLSEVYEAQQKTLMSLKFLKTHNFLKDSLFKSNKFYNTISLNDKIRANEMMRTFEKLEKERKQQEKSNKFSKLINILSIALITILSLLSLSLYKNNLIRNKSNQLLLDKNNELEIANSKIEKASKARAEFLSTVSHELRTPLNAINGISHILLDDKPKPSQIEYLKSLKFSGNYLLTYINEILEINRIESDNIEVENISFNFLTLLENIYNSLKEQASSNNNDLNLVTDKNIPAFLIGDPTKLSQILINLINNSLKFTDNGVITIETKIVNLNTQNCIIQFNVHDTGIGIPDENKESIFESFSQGSVEINRKYGGTGLGLTIVKRLVTILGGNISLESQVGKGSTFTFVLDFKIGAEVVLAQTHVLTNEKVFINKKILLVEDNKINQMVTKKILEKKRIICEICETGEEAIEKVKTNNYDLVLMDVHLPGINGTIATAEIRKFNSEIIIIALTAISLNENREMLLSFGMTDVITKPFNPDHFYKTLENHFS